MMYFIKMERDQGLDLLLEAQTDQFWVSNDYWIKVEVQQVVPSEQRPHGIRYTMTLHDKYNQRVMGYDNAHAVQPKRKKYAGKLRTWDHKHPSKTPTTIHYEFVSAFQLLEDFYRDVNQIVFKGKE